MTVTTNLTPTETYNWRSMKSGKSRPCWLRKYRGCTADTLHNLLEGCVVSRSPANELKSRFRKADSRG